MTDKTLLLFAPLLIVLLACAVLIVWRLRRLSALRVDAERRAVVAFEEMNRLTKELRERGTAPSDPSLTLGARLRQTYPGPSRRNDEGDSEAQ